MTFGSTAPQNIFHNTATLTNGDPWRFNGAYQTYERTGTSDFRTILYVAGPLDARGDREARDLALLRALEDRYGDRVAYVEAGWDLKDWMAHFERERNLFGELLAFLEETKLEFARARVRAKDVLADFRLEQRHRRLRVPVLGVAPKVFTRPAFRARSPRRRTNFRVRRRSTKPKAWTT